MENIARYFLYFMFYSILGWIMEVVVKLITKKKLINRGFLIGPYCPIYGFGGIIIILLIGNNKEDIFSIFLKSMAICSILEYFTSLIMEKIFKVRWWDYSNNKFNINGRICLETMVPFGLLAVAVTYIIQPIVEKLVGSLSINTSILIALVLFVIFIIDNIISSYILLKIRGTIKQEKKDNTEKIKKHIEKWLEDNSILFRRIKKAFPRFQIFRKK